MILQIQYLYYHLHPLLMFYRTRVLVQPRLEHEWRHPEFWIDEWRFQWHERTIINLKATIVWLATIVRAGSMLEMFRTKTQQDRDVIVSKLVAIAGVMNVKYDSVSTMKRAMTQAIKDLQWTIWSVRAPYARYLQYVPTCLLCLTPICIVNPTMWSKKEPHCSGMSRKACSTLAQFWAGLGTCRYGDHVETRHASLMVWDEPCALLCMCFWCCIYFIYLLIKYPRVVDIWNWSCKGYP